MTRPHAGMPAGVESLRRLIGEESESAEEQQGQVGTTSRHAFIVASPSLIDNLVAYLSPM